MSWDEEETSVPADAIEVQEIKLFGKWNPSDVQVSDISLTVSYQKFLNLNRIILLKI